MFDKIATGFGITAVLAYLALIVAAGYGWVHNILMLVNHVGPFAIKEVIRIIGVVVFPVGIVMGYV